MGAAARGVTEKEDEKQRMHSQDVFDRMVLFLAALTRGLCSSVLGADNAPCGLVMGTRGASGATPGGGASSSGVTSVAASASATPSRWARAVSERAGASPRLRRAARSTGKRT